MSLITPIVRYGKRILKVTPDLILGTGKNGSEAIGKVMKNTAGNPWQKAKAGFRYIEGNAAATGLSTWGRTSKYMKDGWKLTKSAFNIPKRFSAGVRLARMKGTSKFLGGLKGVAKGFGKAMPFIGTGLIVASEIPNIWTAVKEKGLIEGVKETGKATAKLAGGAAGAAAGAAIGSVVPVVGTAIGSIVGWFAGEWLTSKAVGKSYTEKKEEQAEKEAEYQENMAYAEQAAMESDAAYAQAQYAQANPAYGSNPFQANGLNTFNPLPYQYNTRSYIA